MRKKKRQRVRAKRGPMTGCAYSRFCPGMTSFAKGAADVTGVTAHTRRAAHAGTIRIGRNGRPERGSQAEFSMAKFAIGEKVDIAANDHESGIVIAVFPTVEGNFRYAVDTEGYGALNFFSEEKLVLRLN
jgi:hypothetical protein